MLSLVKMLDVISGDKISLDSQANSFPYLCLLLETDI